MDLRGLGVAQTAYFLLSKHIKQLVLVTFCDTPAGIDLVFGRTVDRQMEEGQTDVEVEIVS